MTAGGQTPEELQTLLQDALLLRDAEALAQLFDDAGVLVAGHGRQQIRGPGEIVSAWLRWQHQRGYLADVVRRYGDHHELRLDLDQPRTGPDPLGHQGVVGVGVDQFHDHAQSRQGETDRRTDQSGADDPDRTPQLGHGPSRPGLRSGGSEATGVTREGREPRPHDPAGAEGPAKRTVTEHP